MRGAREVRCFPSPSLLVRRLPFAGKLNVRGDGSGQVITGFPKFAGAARA